MSAETSIDVNTTYEPYAEEPEYIEANRALIDTLPLSDTRRVLDLACGTGLLSGLVLERVPNAIIYGIDLSAESLNIGRRQFREKGLLVDSRAALESAAAAGKGAIYMHEGSADDLDDVETDSIDLVTIGNAIHLMPDKDKFLAGVARVLRPGGCFTFNSVFFSGTFGEGSEPLYTEWMKEAVSMLMEKNRQRIAAGEKPIPRKRGTVGKAFDKGWLSPEGWAEKLAEHGLKVNRNYKRPIEITPQGLALVGAYGGLAEVLMSGYPVEIASECLQVASPVAFERLGLESIVRYWLEITAVR